MRFETAAVAANGPYGHRLAATRPPRSLVKSPSGVPPSVSIPKTANRPEQDNGRPWPPFGNRTSTEPLPYQPRPRRRYRETPGRWNPSRSPAPRSTSQASNTHCSSGFPARASQVSASVSSKDLHDPQDAHLVRRARQIRPRKWPLTVKRGRAASLDATCREIKPLQSMPPTTSQHGRHRAGVFPRRSEAARESRPH